MVPWKMRARWLNCRKFCNSVVCSCVHVFREGNQVADALAKNAWGLALYSSQWWPAPHLSYSLFFLGIAHGYIALDWLLIDMCHFWSLWLYFCFLFFSWILVVLWFRPFLIFNSFLA